MQKCGILRGMEVEHMQQRKSRRGMEETEEVGRRWGCPERGETRVLSVIVN